MSWRGIITLILLACAAITGWSLWSQRIKDRQVPQGNTRSDYVLNQFELVKLDAQGKESFTLRAPKLTRDPTRKTMDIATPLFTIPPRANSNAQPWEVRAQTGWVSAEGEELRLRGQVRASSTDAQGRPLNVATEQLNVFPKDKRATSAVAVTITQPGLILNGHGLEARLDAKRFNLKDVKARYERTAR